MLKVVPKTTPTGHIIPFTSNYNRTIRTQTVDDIWEQNDWIYEAKTVSFGQTNNLVALDQDYFNTTFTAGNWIKVTILFSHAHGDLDLCLYDPDGYIVSWSLGYTDNEISSQAYWNPYGGGHRENRGGI